MMACAGPDDLGEADPLVAPLAHPAATIIPSTATSRLLPIAIPSAQYTVRLTSYIVIDG